jgi:catechol 2,3-dioxygenase-like lactoylglutathione lyase family enzyme
MLLLSTQAASGSAAENVPATGIRIELTSVFVTDQAQALAFYTEVLGFEVARDEPIGEHRWLTVRSPAGVDGVELLLEPDALPTARRYRAAIFEQGIPATAFFVDDLAAEHARLEALGVRFVQPPTETPFGLQAILDDTVGNLILLFEQP